MLAKTGQIEQQERVLVDFWTDGCVDVDELRQWIKLTAIYPVKGDDPAYFDVLLNRDTITVGFGTGQLPASEGWPDPDAEPFTKFIEANDGISYEVKFTPRPFKHGPSIRVTYDIEVNH